MKSYIYHKNIKIQSNISNSNSPLVVNCAGYVTSRYEFLADGRRHDYYLQLIEKGRHFCDQMTAREYSLGPGDFVIRSPEIPYRYGIPDDGNRSYYCIHFTGSYVKTLLESVGLECDTPYHAGGISPKVKQCFEDIYREFIDGHPGTNDMLSSLLTTVLIELGRAAHGYDVSRRDRFSDVLDFIHGHYVEDISITTLASLAHLSESRFRKTFGETFGTSPSEYVTQLRIRSACDLLCETDKSVSDIALECGYRDKLYFMRLFKQRTGKTALAYRRANR